MKIRNVNPDRITKILTAISFGFNDFSKSCEFVFDTPYKKISPGDKNHFSRAIATAEQLGTIKVNGTSIKDGGFELVIDKKYNPRTWTVDEQRVFFREVIQSFDPFTKYYDFIAKGYSHSSSATKISSYYGIDPYLSGDNNILRKWGEYALIFDSHTGNVDNSLLKSPISNQTRFFMEVLEDLNNDLARRTFLLKWLGEETFNFIDKDIINDLISALKYYDTDPTKSIRNAGNALEDHLKLLASFRNIQLLNQKGKSLKTIGSIIQKLREEKVLANHHLSTLKGLEVFLSSEVFQGLNAFRTMPSHGKTIDDNQRWELSSEIALLVVLQIILAIKSTYFYVIKQKLLY